jgi:PAS domain S-box-containing protein
LQYTADEQRVLALMPNAGDGERTATFLAAVGVPCTPCKDVPALCRAFRSGAGAILIAEESLLGDTSGQLRDALSQQPVWSAVPLVVMARETTGSRLDRLLSGAFANVMLVERPVRRRTLVSIVRAALRARLHQYEVRDAVTKLERQEQALRESDERMRFALHAARLGSWELDVVSGAFECSETFKEQLGLLPHHPVTQQDLVEHIHPDDLEPVKKELRRSVEDGGDFDIEARNVWADGQVRWILARGRAAPGSGGARTRLVGISLDITEGKRAHEDLERQAAQLREADKRKDEFLATLAHELRNPLAPLRTGLEILKRAPHTDAGARARATMDRQVGHMVRLIDDLLEVSRITLGKVMLKKERVTLQSVIEAAVETSRPVLDSARHTLAVDLPDEPIWVEADRTRLAQVVSNLLNNAAKYTPSGGRVDISATLDGNEAIVRVRDNGMGIPKENLPEAFELFSQLNRALDRSQGGLGIGLALVKKLIDMHGGTIEGESEGLGRGSTFTMRIPALPPASSTEFVPAPEQAPVLDARCILVVDDNHDAAESLSELLGTLGHHTRMAHSGPEALAAAVEFHPDLIFLDIGMPGLSGYEVARRLRKHPKVASAMLVALTGWGTEEDKKKARDAGFDEHVTKPIDIEAIETVLAKATTGGARHWSEAR